MTKDDIVVLPKRVLRERSARVHVVTDETRKVIADMKAATLDWEASRPHEIGVALAAVQIGKLLRIVIVRSNFDNKEDRTFVVLINPEIVKLEGDISYDPKEGCLSVPDMYGVVPRYSKVRVRALDENGREIHIKAEGFLARVLQHEIDHTNGIVFVDHIKDEDAFYKLAKDGKLNKVAHGTVLKNHLLWQ